MCVKFFDVPLCPLNSREHSVAGAIKEDRDMPLEGLTPVIDVGGNNTAYPQGGWAAGLGGALGGAIGSFVGRGVGGGAPAGTVSAIGGAAVAAEILSGQAIMDGIGALDSRIAGVNNQIGQMTIAGLQAMNEQNIATCQGFSALGAQVRDAERTTVITGLQGQAALSKAISDLGFQQAQSCCDIRADVNTGFGAMALESANKFGALSLDNARSTCAVTTAVAAEGAATRDLIRQQAYDALHARYEEALRENCSLKDDKIKVEINAHQTAAAQALSREYAAGIQTVARDLRHDMQNMFTTAMYACRHGGHHHDSRHNDGHHHGGEHRG